MNFGLKHEAKESHWQEEFYKHGLVLMALFWAALPVW